MRDELLGGLAVLGACFLVGCGDDKPSGPVDDFDAGRRDSAVSDGGVTDAVVADGDAFVDPPWDGSCAPLGGPIVVATGSGGVPYGVAVTPGFNRPSGAVDLFWTEGALGSQEIRRQSYSSTTGQAFGETLLVSRPVNAMDRAYSSFSAAQGASSGLLAVTGSVAGTVVPLAQHLKADGSIGDAFAAALTTDGAMASRVVTTRLAAGSFVVAWLEAESAIVQAHTIAVAVVSATGEVSMAPVRIAETNAVRAMTLARDGSDAALVWSVNNDEGTAQTLKVRPIGATGTLASAASTLVVTTEASVLDVSALRLSDRATAIAWSESRFGGTRTDIILRRMDDDGVRNYPQNILPGGEGQRPHLAYYDADSFALVYYNPNFRSPSLRFRRLGRECEPEDEVTELLPLEGGQLVSLAAGSSSDRRTVGVAYQLNVLGAASTNFLPIRCR